MARAQARGKRDGLKAQGPLSVCFEISVSEPVWLKICVFDLTVFVRVVSFGVCERGGRGLTCPGGTCANFAKRPLLLCIDVEAFCGRREWILTRFKTDVAFAPAYLLPLVICCYSYFSRSYDEIPPTFGTKEYVTRRASYHLVSSSSRSGNWKPLIDDKCGRNDDFPNVTTFEVGVESICRQ